MTKHWETVEQAAQEYVSLLVDMAPNAWGQHIHPVYGMSHSMLYRIQRQFGNHATDTAIDAEFARRREWFARRRETKGGK